MFSDSVTQQQRMHWWIQLSPDPCHRLTGVIGQYLIQLAHNQYIRAMEPKAAEPEEEGLLKSPLQQTLLAIDERLRFFRNNHLSHESELSKVSEPNPKSISDLIPSLGVYSFGESPIEPALRDLYTSQYQTLQYRCVLPPPSEGEESIDEKSLYEPTFDWLSRAIIDSNLLTLDQQEAKKSERGKVPEDWNNVNELLVVNVAKKIHLKSEVRSVSGFLNDNFVRYPWVKIKKVKQLYYRGKPSILIRFTDYYSCSFSYYNLTRNDSAIRQNLGPDMQIHRIVLNRVKTIQEQKWTGVIFRRLPPTLNKQILLQFLRKRGLNPAWMEELVQIEHYKYTLCKVGNLDEVFEFCSVFQTNSPIKGVTVNLHPKSSKIWKRQQEQYMI